MGSATQPSRAHAAVAGGRAELMDLAIGLARERLGRVSPRPAVGAVVVCDGEVVASGATEPVPGPHAERAALARAGVRARGADLYLSLEPCSHFGDTPPCTDAIIETGVARVFIAVSDPNPKSGDGVGRLRQAGLEVEVGLRGSAASELNQGFFKWIATRRPYVTAKWAMTLDGKIATRLGESRYISGEESRGLVHAMRREADAVLVGIGALLADDPLLTSRAGDGGGPQPLRVVLDRSARTPPDAAMLRASTPGKTLVAAGAAAPAARVRALERAGAEVWRMPNGESELEMLLDELGRRNLLNLLVEGGGTVLGAFFDRGLVDRTEVFLAPAIFGGAAAPGPVGGCGIERLEQAARPLRFQVESSGPDVHISAVLKRYGPALEGEAD